MPSDPIVGTPSWDSPSMPLNTERGDASELRTLVVEPMLNRMEATIACVPGAAPVGENLHGLYVRDGLRGRCISIGALFSEVPASVSYNTTWRQSANSVDHPLAIRVTDLLPPKGRIRSFGVYGYGATGHTGLPTAPIVALVQRDFNSLETAGNTTIGNAAPTPPSVSFYQSPHVIEGVLVTPHTINDQSQYQIFVYGETGANYVAGLTITGVYLEIIR